METFCITSERGKEILVVQGYKFSSAKILKTGENFWRCVKRTCSAKVWTMGATERVISRSDLVHNHQHEMKNLNRQIVSSVAKKRATEDILERPAKVIRDAIHENTRTFDTLTQKDVLYVRNTIYYQRKKMQLTLPKNADETVQLLKETEFETSKGEKFSSFVNEAARILVFSCETNLRALCAADVVYLDGTFNYCLNYFVQLFTLHILTNGHYIPLVFCVLPNKHSSSYELTFKLIMKECVNFTLQFKPSRVVVDFERSIHKALYAVWPDVILTGCRFHLSQNWFRKIQNLGLPSEHQKGDSDVGKWLNYIFGLPYLNPSEVCDCFTLDLMSIHPEDPRLTKFSDYLVENYICEDAAFPPEIWASFTAATDRTTNACESFHSDFNRNFYKAHPSLFIFVNILLNFQTMTYIKLNSLNEPVRKHDPQTRRRQAFIQNKINNYDSLGRLLYVKCLGYFNKVFH